METQRVTSESGWARSEIFYIVSFGFMGFVWVHGFLLGLRLCLSFRCMVIFSVYGFRLGLLPCHYFRFMVFLYSFRFLSIRWYRREEVWVAHRAREVLWRENVCLTTTATQLGRGLSYCGYKQIQGYWKQTLCMKSTGLQGSQWRNEWQGCQNCHTLRWIACIV